MKRFLLFTITLLIFVSSVLPASAAVKDEVELLYTHINSVSAGLSIDETWGIATCSGGVDAKKILPVKVTVNLQVYKDGYWQTLKTWSETGTATANTSFSYAIASGYKYRTYTIGYVYNSEGVILESASAIQAVNYS